MEKSRRLFWQRCTKSLRPCGDKDPGIWYNGTEQKGGPAHGTAYQILAFPLPLGGVRHLRERGGPGRHHRDADTGRPALQEPHPPQQGGRGRAGALRQKRRPGLRPVLHGVASVLIRSMKGITCMMNKTKLCRAAAAALCAL